MANLEATRLPVWYRGLRNSIANVIRAERAETDKLRGYLNRAGWGECNIPACNCNGWHQVRPSWTEGELESERDQLIARIAELEKAVEAHSGDYKLSG